MTWSTGSRACSQTISSKASTRRSYPKPTSCPTPHRKRRMSNKAHNLARKKILWTEQRKELNKALVISRSRNKTDGCPSQMVGRVSYPLPSCRDEFDLLVPCVTDCVFACLAMALCESRGLASSQALLQASPHSSRLLYSSHDLHPSSTLTGQLYTWTTHSSTCRLTILRPTRHVNPAAHLISPQPLMLTYETLLQLLES